MPDPLSEIQAYADAQSALERIEERRRLSPVRAPWRIRCLIAERQALARIDHMPLTAEAFRVDGRGAVSTSAYDLSHWSRAVDAPIRLAALLSDPVALLQWLGALDDGASPLADAMPHMIDSVSTWQRDALALPPSPPLLHAAALARLWLTRAPLGRGDAVAALLVGDRWGPGRWRGSAGGLTALGLDGLGQPWRNSASAQLFGALWLRAIAAGARHHLDLELRLRAYAARAAGHVAARRRPGMLKPLLMFAMAHPIVTSAMVARHLRLTAAGAIKMLTLATDLGLLVERSGQASYRSYAIPVTPPPVLRSAPPDRDQPDEFWSWDDDAPPLAGFSLEDRTDSENT